MFLFPKVLTQYHSSNTVKLKRATRADVSSHDIFNQHQIQMNRSEVNQRGSSFVFVPSELSIGVSSINNTSYRQVRFGLF